MTKEDKFFSLRFTAKFYRLAAKKPDLAQNLGDEQGISRTGDQKGINNLPAEVLQEHYQRCAVEIEEELKREENPTFRSGSVGFSERSKHDSVRAQFAPIGIVFKEAWQTPAIHVPSNMELVQ